MVVMVIVKIEKMIVMLIEKCNIHYDSISGVY